MQSLHGILRKFVREHGLEGGVVIGAVRSKWEGIVGSAVAAHTFPDTVKGKVLTLLVDTPQWMHHLSFYKEDISEKLRSFDIIDIRFRIGRLPERTGETLNKEDAVLSEEDIRYINNTVKNIKDEDLKERFRKLISHGLTKGRK